MTWENERPQVLSHPVRIRWAGWESDTYTLQRFGWEFSACEDPMHHTLQILLKNEKLRIQGRSEKIQLDYMELVIDPEYARSIILNCYLASQYQITEHSYDHFCAIDCEPTYIMTNLKTINIKDLRVFRTVNPNVQKVYLEEPSMVEILNMALKKQAPRQEEIRKQLLKREHLEAISRNSELSAELRLVI